MNRLLPALPFLALAAATAAPPASGQSSDAGSAELAPILPRAREIALARSAAPAEISREATVLALVRGRGYEVAEEGSNGVTCLVDRSWPLAIEPHCFDPEGSRTILRVRLLEAELKEKGWTKGAIQEEVAEAFRTGRLRAPARPAVTWMMSAAQELYDDDGRAVGAWKPHLMIYHPYLSEVDIGITDGPPDDGPMVVDPGRPTSNLVIVMPSFVQPGGGSG
jgi:hypothetical protein